MGSASGSHKVEVEVMPTWVVGPARRGCGRSDPHLLTVWTGAPLTPKDACRPRHVAPSTFKPAAEH